MEMQTELKRLNTELKKDFEEFKTAHGKELDEVKKYGRAAKETEEKVNRISENMTKVEDKIEEIKTVLDRANTKFDSPEAAKAEAQQLSKKAAEMLFRGQKGGQLAEERKQAYLAEMKEYMGENSREYKALVTFSDPDGGFFVRPESANEIIRHTVESSPIRELATVRTIRTQAFEQPYNDRSTRPGVSKIQEGGSWSETQTAKLQMLRIPVHKMNAYPEISVEMIEDGGIDVEQWHQQEVSEEFGLTEADWFVNGDGADEARGFLTYTAGDGFDRVQQLASGSSGSFDGDDLIDLQNLLFERYQSNATWLMKRSVFGTLRKLKDGDGRYLLSQMGGLLNTQPRELLDRPVRLADDMPAAGANSLSIAYGDFRQGYMVVDRVGIRVVRDIYTSPGNVRFQTTKRVGGGVRNFQAIKLLKLGS